MTETAKEKPQPYQVVSRRYRPQSFDELIGQPHITQALSKAIQQNRVGHAYLFTGARGTGKTSTARIFAKCLNCVDGPTVTPCHQCDSCLGIAAGDDLDVIEIDGASNRGIDEIRQLRSNVGIRPSRSRYKIYIIDEVHMLTTPAFNALLKTLEEPPGHVKFFFCTTDPQKVPLTVLSRCQRYDFMPVETAQIAACLGRIAASERVEAEPQALELLARRAAGSLRDSQSLLEQLLSFCTERITMADVLTLLGIADSQRLMDIVAALVSRDVAGAFREIDRAVQEGVEIGQLTQQLVGVFRDVIALKVGCDADLLLQVVGDGATMLNQLSHHLTLDQWLAMLQIMDQALSKMHYSLHGRILLETACVRICQLDQLQPIGELLKEFAPRGAAMTPRENMRPNVAAYEASSSATNQTLASESRDQTMGQTASNADRVGQTAVAEPETAKKKDLLSSARPTDVAGIPTDVADPVALWQAVIQRVGGMTTNLASQFAEATWADTNLLRVVLNNEYHCQMCHRPERKERLESALRELTGRTIRVEFRVAEDSAQPQTIAPLRASRRQLQQQLERNPLVRQAMELFDADVIDFLIGQRRPPVVDDPTTETEVEEEIPNYA